MRVPVLTQTLSRQLIDEVLAVGDEQDLIGLALNRTLPADVVDALVRAPSAEARRYTAQRHDLSNAQAVRLAADPDEGVRVLLALHHPTAPPALLLHVYLDHQGCVRRQLLDRPQFPTTGLTEFASHPDPDVRRLVARDSQADPAIVERMLMTLSIGDRDRTPRCRWSGAPRQQRTGAVFRLDMIFAVDEFLYCLSEGVALSWLAASSSPVRRRHR